MILGVPLYGLLLWLLPEVAFLNHTAITFAALIVVMGVVTAMRPLPVRVTFTTMSDIDLRPSRSAKWFGAVVTVVTVALYVYFR